MLCHGSSSAPLFSFAPLRTARLLLEQSTSRRGHYVRPCVKASRASSAARGVRTLSIRKGCRDAANCRAALRNRDRRCGTTYTQPQPSPWLLPGSGVPNGKQNRDRLPAALRASPAAVTSTPSTIAYRTPGCSKGSSPFDPKQLSRRNGTSATICGGYAEPLHKAPHRFIVNCLQLSHNPDN